MAETTAIFVLHFHMLQNKREVSYISMYKCYDDLVICKCKSSSTPVVKSKRKSQLISKCTKLRKFMETANAIFESKV